MNRPTIFAALAVTATLASAAYAQQAGPGDTSQAQVQQRSEGDDQAREDSGRRWRREFRSEERGERRERRSGDRMNPEMMRERMARMCERGGRFSDRMIERIERATQPTAEQKPKFDALKDASTKAAGIVKAACPAEPSFTPTGRLAAAEKRRTAMLEAVRTVRPAMDAFYGSLTDEQKARLSMSRRAMGPTGDRRGEWRGPERGEPRDEYRGRRFGRDEDRQGDERGERGDRTTYSDDTTASEPL
jgi:Ni/Co efflux regulator RcnB